MRSGLASADRERNDEVVPYRVHFAPRLLEEDFPTLPGEVIDALLGDPEDSADLGKVGVLATNPEVGKPLRKDLQGFRRLTLAGRYRVVYRTWPRSQLVGIILVGIRRGVHRSDAYQRVRKLVQELPVEQILQLELEGARPRRRSRRGRSRKDDP